MAEFYIETNSFAAPFLSDPGHTYVDAETPEDALLRAAAEYSHPFGLYAAAAYSSADAKNKGEKPLARWLSNHAKALVGVTGMITSLRPGLIEINGEKVEIEDPKGGSVE
ncbi:hypothetical protein SZ64_04580 [Erythrobacter sp. SG61-1L]|uniref:hypothetical protein n=1 Tax=Erythrobacter sp. SG61-1L TaxID=1603897 RepID=UPI0006C8FB92|nr:hypothetical protein [Erythrobacter sp. SG61-1L]KPL67442.1 hypothetical protein SZ64_04580 [Erythrobacter sp. SG61-1L]